MKPLGDAALLFRRSVGEGRRDPGPAYVLPAMPPLLMVLVFTVADDRLRECWVYDADPTLLDRFFATN